MKSSDIQTIEKIKSKNDTFDIRWRVSTLCNYECDFCIQGNREEHLRKAEGESSELRNKICDAIVQLIERIGSDYRVIYFNLLGGEVTVFKDFPAILGRLASSRFEGEIRFSITTNFSADLSYFQSLLDRFREGAKNKKRKLSISASFYPQYVTLEQFSEKLRDVAAYAGIKKNALRDVFSRFGLRKGNDISLESGIPIVNDEDYENYVRIKEAFRDTEIRIFPIIIRKYHTSISKDNIKEIIDVERKQLRVTDVNGNTSFFPNIRALGAALEGTDTFCPTGYLCGAGIHNISIDAFGNVSRCPSGGNTMSMGNILDGTFRLLNASRICTSDHCSCGVYGKIEKTGTPANAQAAD